MPVPEIELLTSYVSQVFRVEDVTAGDGKGLIARYRGRLMAEDSVAAYDRLDDLLRPYRITPLFRKDGEKQTVLLVTSPEMPGRPPRVWVNILLFILTLFAAMLTGVEVPLTVSLAGVTADLSYRLQHILSGW